MFYSNVIAAGSGYASPASIVTVVERVQVTVTETAVPELGVRVNVTVYCDNVVDVLPVFCM